MPRSRTKAYSALGVKLGGLWGLGGLVVLLAKIDFIANSAQLNWDLAELGKIVSEIFDTKKVWSKKIVK